jgi:hypothetical protein
MTGPFSLVSDIAMEYRRRGLSPIPLRAREKEPFHATWPSMPEIDDWTPYSRCNVGIRLGKPSNGVIDADLDWPEARALAPFVLPPTQSIFGRASSRGAHRLYRCSDPPERASQQWLTPLKREGEKGCILEIRSTGGQTMSPPSVHPCGETLEWESDGPPAEVEMQELRRAASVCVAAALLMRHWPDEGSRFFAYGAAIGAFLRWGVPADIVQEIIRIIAEKFTPAHDRTKRVRAVTKMAANLAAGTGRVPGYRRLKQIFGEQIARTVRSWLVSLGDGSVYRVIGGALCYMKADRNDLVIPVKLANFSARRDDPDRCRTPVPASRGCRNHSHANSATDHLAYTSNPGTRTRNFKRRPARAAWSSIVSWRALPGARPTWS